MQLGGLWVLGCRTWRQGLGSGVTSGSHLRATLSTVTLIPKAAPLQTPPLALETRAGWAKADSATATVLLGLTTPAHSTPSALLHNPEAASSLTLAEELRGHVTGQLQAADGASPTVFFYKASRTLSTADSPKHSLFSVEGNSLCSAVFAQRLQPLPFDTIP